MTETGFTIRGRQSQFNSLAEIAGGLGLDRSGWFSPCSNNFHTASGDIVGTTAGMSNTQTYRSANAPAPVAAPVVEPYQSAESKWTAEARARGIAEYNAAHPAEMLPPPCAPSAARHCGPANRASKAANARTTRGLGSQHTQSPQRESAGFHSAMTRWSIVDWLSSTVKTPYQELGPRPTT